MGRPGQSPDIGVFCCPKNWANPNLALLNLLERAVSNVTPPVSFPPSFFRSTDSSEINRVPVRIATISGSVINLIQL